MARGVWVCALIAGGFCARVFCAELPESAQEALLEVTVNGQVQPNWTLIRLTADGAPWVRRADLQTWGLRLGEDSPIDRLPPDTPIALNEVPGVHASVDCATSRMVLEVQPALLSVHEFHSQAPRLQPMPSPLGVFLNYDLGATQQGGPSELRAATELGMVRGNWVARSSWFDSTGAGQVTNVRLDTNVTADFPATRTSMQWGDTFARLGTNADSVRIAGMSWGTDFSVTPNFITVPLPTFSNVTATPGTVDLYVNGAKTQQLTVPAGPFSVSGVPVTTGAGELTVVTHDLLGHTQTYTQSYYISPQMLQAGLTAWDFQAGTKRLDYGSENNQYSGWLAAAGQRYGISDRLTAQWRVEADETGAAISAQWLGLTPADSLLTFSPSCAAVSGQTGCLLDAAYERDLSRIGYGYDLRYSTPGYIPVAAAERGAGARWQLFSHVQATVDDGFSFMVGGTWRAQAGGARSLSLNLTAGKSWFGGGHLDLAVSRTSGTLASSLVTLIYTHGIGSAQTVSATAYSADGRLGAQATVQRNLPAGNGFGYLLRVGQDSSASAEAIAQWNGDSVAVAGIEQREGNRNLQSAEVSGAALWVGDDWFLARHLDRSFALVHAPNLPGVPVYLNDQPVARTDTEGTAVLPDLRPFEVNKIDLDLTTLPLALDIPQSHFEVIPYRRGGVGVEVPVQFAAAVRLQLADGEPVPAGARVRERRGSAPVGTEGRAYVEGPAGENLLRITWDGGECRTVLRLPVTSATDPIDDGVHLLCVASR